MKIYLTLKRCDEISALEKRIDELEKELEEQRREAYRLQIYGQRYLAAVDELNEAKKRLQAAGLPVNWMRPV